jgi:hypothetical protein
MAGKRHELGLKKTVAKKETANKSDVTEAIDRAIESIQEKLATEDLKPSVTDLVRLLQLRRDLSEEQPKQVTVRWIEGCSEIPASEE